MKRIRREFLLALSLAGIFLTIPPYKMMEAHSPTGWAAPSKGRS